MSVNLQAGSGTFNIIVQCKLPICKIQPITLILQRFKKQQQCTYNENKDKIKVAPGQEATVHKKCKTV